MNQIFSKFVPTTSYDLWYGKKPTLGYLKIWGCPAHVKQQQVDKLETRFFRTHFIGYSKEIMGYYFYLPKDHNMIVSRHAIFLEKEFIQDEDSRKKIKLEKKISKEHRV